MGPGLYRVVITKDGVKIPEKYSTEANTVLGQEIARDAAGIGDMKGIKFKLEFYRLSKQHRQDKKLAAKASLRGELFSIPPPLGQGQRKLCMRCGKLRCGRDFPVEIDLFLDVGYGSTSDPSTYRIVLIWTSQAAQTG